MVFGGVDAQRSAVGDACARAGRDSCRRRMRRTLRIDGGVLPGDPLAGRWQPGAMIGGLGLQPQTRRRNRINGVVKSVQGETLLIDVTQSFGNCAKYIQSRTPTFVEPGARLPATPPEVATQLSDADRALLMRADTFFIASANLDGRGGARARRRRFASRRRAGLRSHRRRKHADDPRLQRQSLLQYDRQPDPRSARRFAVHRLCDRRSDLSRGAGGSRMGWRRTGGVRGRGAARAFSYRRSAAQSWRVAVPLVGRRIRSAVRVGDSCAGARSLHRGRS